MQTETNSTPVKLGHYPVKRKRQKLPPWAEKILADDRSLGLSYPESVKIVLITRDGCFEISGRQFKLPERYLD